MGDVELDAASTEAFNDALVAAVRFACECARVLATSDSGLPQHQFSGVERIAGGMLRETVREEASWKLAALRMQQTTANFWDRIKEASEAVADDPAVDAWTGVAPHTDQRATQFFHVVLAPMFARYGARQPDLQWNPSLARELVNDFRAAFSASPIPHRTIAPLHNFVSTKTAVSVDADTVIRELTDDDRDELWRRFGGGAPSTGLTLGQLDDWTHAIDARWGLPRQPPYSDELIVERISDIVTALRLHHPGVTGTTFLWTRLDPPDAPAPQVLSGQTLSAPVGDPLFRHPLRTMIGPNDGPALAALITGVATARGTKRVELALRRFNRAYERHSLEDTLIDLWIGFEALLGSVQYRAALRIGRLAGSTSSERWDAFEKALESSKYRNRVVHGSDVDADLEQVVERTRQLARIVLRTWVTTLHRAMSVILTAPCWFSRR